MLNKELCVHANVAAKAIILQDKGDNYGENMEYLTACLIFDIIDGCALSKGDSLIFIDAYAEQLREAVNMYFKEK